MHARLIGLGEKCYVWKKEGRGKWLQPLCGLGFRKNYGGGELNGEGDGDRDRDRGQREGRME